MLHHVEVMKQLVTLSGCRTLPRYLLIDFTVSRVTSPGRPHAIDPAKEQLRQQVRELRNQGMSYPQIAKLLGISVGTVWNYAQH